MREKKSWTINHSIRIQFFLFTILLLATESLFFYTQSSHVLQEQFREHLMNTAKPVASMSAASLELGIDRLKTTILIILGLGMIGSWYICGKIFGQLFEPLGEITQATEEVAKKNFSIEQGGSSGTDLDQLNQTLNDVYKSVIYAVSHGKFHLLNETEMYNYLSEGDIIARQGINQPEDVGACRKVAEQILAQQSFGTKDISKTILAISEGATNVLKHADSGRLAVIRCDNKLKFVLSDRGKGMPYDKIPQMVFLGGFSTKQSLGYGFYLMYMFADKLVMRSATTGTTLVLEKNIVTESIKENRVGVSESNIC